MMSLRTRQIGISITQSACELSDQRVIRTQGKRSKLTLWLQRFLVYPAGLENCSTKPRLAGEYSVEITGYPPGRSSLELLEMLSKCFNPYCWQNDLQHQDFLEACERISLYGIQKLRHLFTRTQSHLGCPEVCDKHFSSVSLH